jgi:arylformamidase
MPLIDVTLRVHPDMHAWPGDPKIEFIQAQAIARGDDCNLSMLSLGAHSGTHVDAPLHFIDGGGAVEALSIETMVGPCRVVRIEGSANISREDVVAAGVQPGERILFKTANSGRLSGSGFLMDFVGVGPEAAELLAEIRPSLIGIDYLSIAPIDSDNPIVHRRLLGAGIILVEGLDLSAVLPGDYELICAPLLLAGLEGAPARVFLRPLG